MLGLAREFYGPKDEITRVLAGLEGSLKVAVVLAEARLRSASVADPKVTQKVVEEPAVRQADVVAKPPRRRPRGGKKKRGAVAAMRLEPLPVAAPVSERGPRLDAHVQCSCC